MQGVFWEGLKLEVKLKDGKTNVPEPMPAGELVAMKTPIRLEILRSTSNQNLPKSQLFPRCRHVKRANNLTNTECYPYSDEKFDLSNIVNNRLGSLSEEFF